MEVDLSYPKSLHKKHRAFPLAPEKADILPDMLSDFQMDCHEKLGTKAKITNKLVATFGKREKYVVHYQNLKLYLELGMRLEAVHKVLSFKQSPFLKKYIDHCTACLLYTSPSPRDGLLSRMPSSA